MRILPNQGAKHSTFYHGDASDGVFLLLHLWVLPLSRVILLTNDLPPLLSLACGWPLRWMALPPPNGSASRNLRLKDLRVQEKGGWTDSQSGPGWPAWADRPRPIPTRFGRPFAPVGPHVFMHFAPPLAPFWRCHPRVQDGGSPCMKFGLLHFNPRGCSFVTLWSLHHWEWFHQALKHEQDS
jgi:hypothetical protein